MSTLHFEDRLDTAISMRANGNVEAAKDLLIDLQQERPDNAAVNLECAWAHDKLGLESEAVHFYETALRLGLEGEDLKNALLGLGSTYRALGEYAKALSTLNGGVEWFPSDRSLQVFRAMALYNNERPKEACELLLQIISATTEDPDIRTYQGAIDVYAADLDRTWS